MRCGRVWDSLNELDGELVNMRDGQNEVKHLESLVLAMLHDQMRV